MQHSAIFIYPLSLVPLIQIHPVHHLPARPHPLHIRNKQLCPGVEVPQEITRRVRGDDGFGVSEERVRVGEGFGVSDVDCEAVESSFGVEGGY